LPPALSHNKACPGRAVSLTSRLEFSRPREANGCALGVADCYFESGYRGTIEVDVRDGRVERVEGQPQFEPVLNHGVQLLPAGERTDISGLRRRLARLAVRRLQVERHRPVGGLSTSGQHGQGGPHGQAGPAQASRRHRRAFPGRAEGSSARGPRRRRPRHRFSQLPAGRINSEARLSCRSVHHVHHDQPDLLLQQRRRTWPAETPGGGWVGPCWPG